MSRLNYKVFGVLNFIAQKCTTLNKAGRQSIQNQFHQVFAVQ
jgi:hypothetical protein